MFIDFKKLSVLSRKDVPYFGPYIQPPFSFKKDEMFKNFLLAKLINAEYSSLKGYFNMLLLNLFT